MKQKKNIQVARSAHVEIRRKQETADDIFFFRCAAFDTYLVDIGGLHRK